MKFAMFTIVKDEPFHLPVWCDYYVRALGSAKDVFIIDHQTGDGSVAAMKLKYPEINLLDIAGDGTAFNHQFLVAWVKEHQRRLLEKYDVVGFAEVDEFLFPPDNETLRQYVERRFSDPKLRYVAARGYEVVHDIDAEKAITSDDEKLLANRHSMWWSPGAYSKTLISRDPLPWIRGFHRLSHEVKVNHSIHDAYVSNLDLIDPFHHRGSPDLAALNLLHRPERLPRKIFCAAEDEAGRCSSGQW